MIGAEALAPAPYLTSDILLNVDSEEEYAICIGCAGGAENDYSIPIQRTAQDNHTQLNFHLKGLLGGHSGIEINAGRANAIKVLNIIFREASRAVPEANGVYVSFTATGAPNVIPREAQAVVSVATEKLSEFLLAVQTHLEKVREVYFSVEHREENGKKLSTINLEIQQLADATLVPLIKQDSERVVDFIDTFISGVIRMNYDIPGEVQTSTNFANLNIVDNFVTAHSFTRSSSQQEMSYAQSSFESFARLTGATISKPLNFFPGWEPEVDSIAVVQMKLAAEEVFGKEPRIYFIHAGLECGLLQGVYPS
jgi:dipeptidase D